MPPTLPIALAVVATLVSHCAARPEFRDRLPNAYNVAGVDAIGHVDKSGGGARNAFGKDFDAAGRKWTTALCQKDSDGDGQTNGQELGDPCCTWVETSNAKALWTTGVSAPGDAASKSDATLWANVTCTTGSPSSTTVAPVPSTTTRGAAGPLAGVSTATMTAVIVVALVNAAVI